jgi:hypothetical protein|nr:MAG TPA: hypothetical protein [Caudoviricetes sp.]
MRLIDRDVIHWRPNENWELYATAADIRAIPIVDAVVVTRCKDCVHWDDDPDTYGTDDGPKGKCMKSFETMCADDFCSHGEPKERTHADNYD